MFNLTQTKPYSSQPHPFQGPRGPFPPPDADTAGGATLEPLRGSGGASCGSSAVCVAELVRSMRSGWAKLASRLFRSRFSWVQQGLEMAPQGGKLMWMRWSWSLN